MFSRIKQLWHRAKAKKGLHKSGKRIKYAFTVGITDYYQLVNDLDLPEKRFAYLRHYYHEMQMRLTKETLLEFMDAMKKAVNPEKGKSVELGKVDRLIDEITERTKWLFEPESLYRMASVVYFTLDEDITDYDERENEAKIKAFKKKDHVIPFLADANRRTERVIQFVARRFKDLFRATGRPKPKTIRFRQAEYIKGN